MSNLFKKSVIYILMSFSILLCLVSGVLAIGEEPVQWMGYPDFMDLEGDKAWLDPEVYLGYSAQFNSVEYSGYRIGNIVDGEFVEVGEVPLAVGNEALRNIGQDYKVKIVDYYVDSTNNNLWYKVEALEGYTLPEEMVNNPYVLYLRAYDVNAFCDAPRLTILPKKAMLYKDSLVISKTMEAASKSVELDAEYVPDFFDVTYVKSDNSLWYGYDLGDVSSWNEEILTSEYRYVDQSYVLLIPADVTIAYEKLLEAETYEEYNEIFESIPDEIKEQFTSVHMNHIEEVEEELKSEVIVELNETIMIDGKNIPITVLGNFVGNYSLSINPVSNNTLFDEGFEIEDIEDIVTALDIKVVDSEGNEWQPGSNQRVWVSIGVSELGYEDGRILRLDHKHGDEITVYEEVIVINGAITIVTDGFSIYTVQNVGSTNRVGTNYTNGQTIDLEIGDKKIIYCDRNVNQDGTWEVEDTSGAIYYTVHTQSSAGHDGVYAPWIEVVCLKESTSPVKLTYRYPNNTETVYLDIDVPTSKIGNKDLYITDDVNRTGRIIVSLCDNNGNDISEQLEGARFSWTRSDNLFITPRAYGDNSYNNDGSGLANSSINIAKDHAGLVEARKNGNDYEYVTYTVEAILADGTELDATYTVYYQSEFINANFEFPEAANRNYTYFVNGQDGLYWKTTAPGSSRNNEYEKLTMDIEIGEVTNFWRGDGQTPNDGNAGTKFGVARAADHDDGGTQFAELNAEAFGALYQDIISVPDEDIEWEFSHAPRRDQTTNSGGWATDVSNAMFIVIGATENAQKITTQDQLEQLGLQAKSKAAELGISDYDNGQTAVEIEFIYGGVNYGKFSVWYHDAGTYDAKDSTTNSLYRDNGVYGKNNNYGWSQIKGSYTTPENQYRTRLFFVSEPSEENPNTLNAGNLIDRASGGIYKTYLIEYYEESFDSVTNEKTIKHLNQYDEKGRALIYSSEKMNNLNTIETKDGDYLHRILINGESYPYEIRSTDPVTNKINASIYIEKYPGKADYVTINGEEDHTNNYDDYQIVVQVFVRDTVIAIEKEIGWPKDTSNNELMTPEQKLEVITNLLSSDDQGYKTVYDIRDTEEDKIIDIDSTIVIKNRSPEGNYTGYISPDNNPALNKHYVVTETYSTPIPGLELESVTLNVTRFRYGVGSNFDSDGDESTNNIIYDVVGEGQYKIRGTSTVVDKLSTDEIYLSEIHELKPKEPGYKVAEIQVINSYKEKITTIKYQAVGNGKVAFIGSGVPEYIDTPTETLPFYSGKAKGAAVHPGKDAIFVGWYLDEECTQQVTAVDGVWDKTTNDFKPNANILNDTEVTFYAKFETASLTINRSNGDKGQTFIYQIAKNLKSNGTADMFIYVSLTCGADGKGSVSVLELGAGSYTVTELTDHSWRFNESDAVTSQTQTMANLDSGTVHELIYNFTGKKSNNMWVNEYADKENIYAGDE